jgi:hypothetical protein
MSDSNGLLAVMPSESNGLLEFGPCLTVMGYLQLCRLRVMGSLKMGHV